MDVVHHVRALCPADFSSSVCIEGADFVPEFDVTYDTIVCNRISARHIALLNPGGLLVGRGTVEDLSKESWTDYAICEDSMVVARKRAAGAAFLPDIPGTLYKKPHRNLIYVLGPHADAETHAREIYRAHEWARIIRIPSTFYLESVMYHTILQRRQREWEHADYVGCVSWTAHTKMQSLDLDHVLPTNLDFVAFLYRGDALVDTATRWHPEFKRVWIPTLRAMGYKESDILASNIPSFYCNYWACRPAIMDRYLEFFRDFKIQLESLPDVQDALWSDAQYKARGKDVAALSDETCMRIWGVPFYTYHPFVCERLPCFFVTTIPGLRIGAIS